jgi:hypothetical protein
MNAGPVHSEILRLTAIRGEGKSVCPSEVARSLSPQGWRELMPAVRQAASELQNEGWIQVTQGGVKVDARSARGPVRLAVPGRALPNQESSNR